MSAVPVLLGLAEVMPLPPGGPRGVAQNPLDLIPKEVRTTRRAHCPKSFGMTGILGRWAVLVNVPCQQWSCEVCGQRKARYYAGIARAGCELSVERLRLLTISCPRETPAQSWAELSGRWDRLSKSLARRLGTPGKPKRLAYFGTVELQRRGNPHLHLLLRDSGFIPKAVVHQLGYAAGFGFSDIRQIQPGAGVVYVTKYLHKSAGQVLEKGARRIRRSRDWYAAPARPTCSWGPDWRWQSVEGLDFGQVERDLVGKGYEVLSYVQRPGDVD
jgi:hypothetical protein